MRRFHSWLVALGLAATPGLVQAGPLTFGRNPAGPQAHTSASTARKSNQQMADMIALALRRASLKGAAIDVQFQEGVAVLGGTVTSPEQKARAAEAASRVPGVRSVQNRLALVPAKGAQQQPMAARRPARPAPKMAPKTADVQQVQYEEVGEGAPADPNQMPPQGAANQQMAQQIASALQESEFVAYDMEVLYENGVAVLRGSVASPQQWQAASAIVSQVPGVQQVDNQLQVAAATVNPMAGQAPPQMAAGGGPMPYGPGAMGPNTIYDQPNLPNHAWPSYASYPNYAQVNYPSQYSASAWPYIGPFYPYPQIPLGWRAAQLEWDDGYWNLNFRPRTDRWWWFMDYRNW